MKAESTRAKLKRLVDRRYDVEILRDLVMAESARRGRDSSFQPCERTLCDAMRESLSAHIARLNEEVYQVQRQLKRAEREVSHGD